MAQCVVLKPFDYFLTNYFGTLDGKKFSTSRNHAIWATEAGKILGASTDTIRAYLSLINPEDRETNFSRSGFSLFKSEWEDDLQRLLNNAIVKKSVARSEPDPDCFFKILASRQEALEPSSFCLAGAIKAIHDWIEIGRAAESRRSWAIGFAALAYPVMPYLAESVWRRCGEVGLPRAEVFHPA
jgi:methionyl-tRNA synthetase